MTLFANFVKTYHDVDASQLYQNQINRLVETQEFAATTTLVDDLDEQYQLEQMLDEVKPRYREGTAHMHYLLKTPFRYPPLKYGSRFGTRVLPSFLYGAEEYHTTLAEVAYYRFIFLNDMHVAYEGVIKSVHLMFWISIDTSSMVDLSHTCFADYHAALRDPQNYDFCQRVGRWLTQEQRVEAIRYFSARCQNGVNVAVYAPSAISSNLPLNQQNWLCLTQPDQISFTQHGGHRPVTFYKQQFLIDNYLPQPA